MSNYTSFPHMHSNFLTNRVTQIVLSTFVFISGYFIGNKKILFNFKDLFNFYKKRIIRIYPLYIVSVYLFMILKLSDPITLFKAGALLSMFIKPVPPTLWFVTMLFLFYMISPILIYASRKFNKTRLVIYYLFFISLLIAYSDATNLLDIRIAIYFPLFASGVFVANSNSIYKSKSNCTLKEILTMSICFLFSFLPTPDEPIYVLKFIPMMLSCSYSLFRSAEQLDISSKLLRKIIITLSYSSYCMYLFHRPIYTLLKGVYFPKLFLYEIGYLLLFCLPCILCCSFIIQKLYDVTIDTLANQYDPEHTKSQTNSEPSTAARATNTRSSR
ncbi:MAG: acyltransferase [Candidatus Electrothrix aestuarii]|uniref:Acyltransferase n=1 Tax=Candidatus Electrothrix aestuarii TaxID=3062594 RepID=A0AAU8M2N8_9BACT